MSYWKLNDQIIKSPVLPYAEPGETLSITMTFVNEDSSTWHKCYLYTSGQWEYKIWAKKSSDSEYLPVSIMGNPLCYIAHLAPGETDIDFRIMLPTTQQVALHQIPIGIGHDAGSYRPSYVFHDWMLPLWAECYEISPLWLTDWYTLEIECSVTASGAGFTDSSDDGFTDELDDGWTD